MACILIADDHDLVRDTIAAYLSKIDGFDVDSASTLDEAAEKLKGLVPYDLAILDYSMPGMNGLVGLKKAIRDCPGVKFALMSGVADASVAREAIDEGAVGFFPKSFSADTMVNAIRFVLSGERYIPLEVVAADSAAAQSTSYRGLSPRELQTLRGLSAGKSNKEIARELNLQEVTVKLHVKNIFGKLGTKNRTQAALLAQNEGFK